MQIQDLQETDRHPGLEKRSWSRTWPPPGSSRDWQQRTKARLMDYFWQIDEAYVRGRYSLCRDSDARYWRTPPPERPP